MKIKNNLIKLKNGDWISRKLLFKKKKKKLICICVTLHNVVHRYLKYFISVNNTYNAFHCHVLYSWPALFHASQRRILNMFQYCIYFYILNILWIVFTEKKSTKTIGYLYTVHATVILFLYYCNALLLLTSLIYYFEIYQKSDEADQKLVQIQVSHYFAEPLCTGVRDLKVCLSGALNIFQ